VAVQALIKVVTVAEVVAEVVAAGAAEAELLMMATVEDKPAVAAEMAAHNFTTPQSQKYY
jgi:hypothetical protein